MKKINKIISLGFICSLLVATSSIDNCVKFSANTDREFYYAGENLFLELNISIDSGYHIYSVDPSKSLSASYIEFTDTTLFSTVGIIHEPKTYTKYDSTFNMDIHFHENKIKFIQDLKITNNLSPGKYKVTPVFEYYACNPKFCVPKFEEFTFYFHVKEGEPRFEYTEELQKEYFSEESKVNVVQSGLNDEINKGLFSFILFAIGMGFISLLTPCVFPMIPITVSYFTKEGEKENNNPLTSALIYALGIIIIFTFLGLLLSFTIGASGAGDLAASPWVNLFIGLLFIYFAFSLFGYYEIQIPASIRQYSLNKEQTPGKLGILFMSLTFTLTSFTCTVAFVGALLAAASTGSYFWPIIGMLSFSTAFAFPFFFLALFPQYLSKLPKSGGWLNSVKVVMGFLELAAAFKFISNSDLVWNWQIFTRDVVLAIWALIFILLSIYLFGKIKMPFDNKVNKLGYPRMIFSVMFLSFGLYLSSGLFGYSINGWIESYLPPEKQENWYENLDEAYTASLDQNKPIFIDFTGYTCTNCRWMELNVFELSEVKVLFKDFILVKLYTDGKEKIHYENRQLEIERFGTAALPYYVVLSPGDKLISTFPGMDTNSQNFIDFLKQAQNDFINEF